jgi:hypothetical protein
VVCYHDEWDEDYGGSDESDYEAVNPDATIEVSDLNKYIRRNLLRFLNKTSI